ncbi:DUF7373 family lipoprotein [Nocardia huaxiensis]|uniref:DUF7373 family lipoprotein n=1 Tax=Nocardia huaxiensis TaxID=2755382 RepID=UPI001E4E4E3F|nr:hypothetical protein [Nocardia huaxiensis]UFS93650.1 hypothetical protein LPY97_22870 [Nocardia huaxiensis]
MRRSERLPRWVTALFAVGLVTGCTSTVPGTPEPAGLGVLDVGGWDTTPLPVPGNGKTSYGRIVESARLADAVINPIDVIGTLGYATPALVPTPLASVGILADVARPILTECGMIAGYSMGANDTGGERSTLAAKSRMIRVTVLSFPDAGAATAAAQRIEAADFAAGAGNEPVTIPGYEGAHSHWRPGVPTLGVYTAHGSFLVALYIRLPEPDSTALAAVAASTLDKQLPQLDAFTPTPSGRLADLPLDPDGVLRRMVSMRPGQWTYPSLSRRENYIDEVSVAIGMRLNGGIVFGPGGVDHLMRTEQTDPTAPGELGIDRMAVTGVETLYRFTDASKARWYYQALVDAIARQVTSSTDGDRTVIAGPAGVPDVFCYRIEFHGADPYNRCYLLDGRYMATVIGPDETFTRQWAAAQYALLVNTR